MRAILTALGRLLRVSRPNKRNVKEMERQVRLLREKIRYLQVIAMRPGHSAKDLERLRWLERAARAQVKRRASEIAFVKDKKALPRMRTGNRSETKRRIGVSRPGHRQKDQGSIKCLREAQKTLVLPGHRASNLSSKYFLRGRPFAIFQNAENDSS